MKKIISNLMKEWLKVKNIYLKKVYFSLLLTIILFILYLFTFFILIMKLFYRNIVIVNLIKNLIKYKLFYFFILISQKDGDWGLGIGDWGLGDWGFGVWGRTPNPPPPTPTPNTPPPTTGKKI